MSALVGYLALGTVDPVTRAFTEAAFAGYGRQPVAFDFDLPTSGGAVDTGGAILRSTNVVTFPAPTALDWPSVNAYAVFTAASGGAASIVVPFGARSGVHARGAKRIITAGRLVLEARAGMLLSPLGGAGPAGVAVTGRVDVLAGLVSIAGISLGGTLPGGATGTSSPGGGATNTADHSDLNNAYLAALAA